MLKLALLGAALALALVSRADAQTGAFQYPVSGSSGNVAAATATATLPAATGLTTKITGFEITAGSATAAACVNATVTGVIGGTMTYVFCTTTAPAQPQPLIVQFNPPFPATSVGVAIVVSMPSLGSGNANAAIVAHGFQQQ